MVHERDNQPLRDRVLTVISAGRVKMRPRWHFVLGAALGMCGGALVALALLYLISFIIFALRMSGAWFVPVFGLRGMRAFLVSLPWLLIAISVVFIIILEVLVRRYAFSYSKPLLYSVFGIILFAAAGGAVVAHTSFHRGIFRYAESHHVPVAGPLYRGYGTPRYKQIHPGVIASTTAQGFFILTKGGETVTVIVTPQTRLPFGFDFVEGDPVVVFGKRDDDTIRAFGIRKAKGMMMGPGGMKPEFHGEPRVRIRP